VSGAGGLAVRPRGRLARFELLRELGRGAQAAVWLAHDPLLEREVALKLLDSHGDAGAMHEWLHEARAVSRLSHPNVVPVFEADTADGQSYLVFEFVEGPTLAEQRRRKPRWPARDAVPLLLGVLDALAVAHEQGIVHRDLKPSNILLGRDGRPRVMDFGIAARVPERGGRSDGRIVGTPGYMSPEAARGEAPRPAMDVFAAGVMLGELLAGAPLLPEADPWRAVERVQREDLALPAEVNVDDTLRSIVQRAIARDAGERYDGARALHAALASWLEPKDQPRPQASHGTLEFLLRRMRHKTDFPALSDAIVRIQRVASSETANLGMLTDEILKDVALTNKLLRMVNSVYFTAVTGGTITTVSRAVQLVGFAGIRNMALSVLLLEHMHDKAHAAQLKGEFVRALMAGTLASELTPLPRDSEEAFLGSMFQNLGRLLTEYYFPEEALQVRKQLSDERAGPAEREAVALRVLGIGLDELGAGVAQAWGLPESLQKAMRVPEGDAPVRAAPRGTERMRWLGRAANGVTDALMAREDDATGERLQAEAERYAAALDLPASQIVGAARTARRRLSQMTRAMGLQVPQSAPVRQLLGPEPAAPESPLATPGAANRTLVEPRPPACAAAPLATDRPQAPDAPGAARPALQVTPQATPRATLQVMLQAALLELERALGDRSLRLNELLNLALETMHHALELRALVFCLREPRSGALCGRFALGDAPAAAFRIVPAAGGDFFAAALARGGDAFVADARTVERRLPAWYRQQVNAGSFLLLPLFVKGAAVGLIYADKATPGALALAEPEIALLRRLRDRLAVAFTRGA
jgi:serine/threonine protein kinase